MAGDAAAFERLYRRHAPRVLGFAMRIVRDLETAEDAVQDAFIQVHKNCRSFRGDSRVGTWIMAIARNACLSRLRRESRRPATALDEAAEVAAPPEKEKSEALAMALASLEPEAREIVMLAAEDLSYEEIGATLGMSADQVRGRLYRARKVLVERMQRLEKR